MKWIGCACLAWSIAFVHFSATAAEIEIGHAYDNLNNELPGWRNTYIEATQKIAERKVVYGVARETERFSFNDREFLAGMYYPLGQRWTVLIEGNASPTHRVLPQWSTLGQVQYAFGQGWGIHLGWRHTNHKTSCDLSDDSRALCKNLELSGTGNITSGINREILVLERYWQNYRAAYTFSASQVEGGGSPIGHALQLGYYYGDRNHIGMIYATGQEVQNVGKGVLRTSDVQTLALTGRYWVTPAWALTHEISLHEQGDIYTRKGIRLGIRHIF